jgi:hypothetical protein
MCKSQRELEIAAKEFERMKRELEARNKLKSPRAGSVSGPGSPTEKWSSASGSRIVPEG